MDERLYRVHHKLSRFRGRVVRVLVRPSTKRKPNNVCCVDVGDDPRLTYLGGEKFICPWRGLRRIREV